MAVRPDKLQAAEGDEAVIVPYRDGPYLIRGRASLRDQEGREIETGRSTFALCRCGKSRLRPFCDGSHHLIRFSAPSGQEERVADSPAAPDRELAVIERGISTLRQRLRKASHEEQRATGSEGLEQVDRLLGTVSALLRAESNGSRR
jgi:CDGSH-type Zn-finger protein